MSADREWTEEDYLHDQLRVLLDSYRRAAQPIIDRLTRIQAMRPSSPIIFEVSPEQAAQLLAQMPAAKRAIIARITGEGEA